jgi:hypothetical protein
MNDNYMFLIVYLPWAMIHVCFYDILVYLPQAVNKLETTDRRKSSYGRTTGKSMICVFASVEALLSMLEGCQSPAMTKHYTC